MISISRVWAVAMVTGSLFVFTEKSPLWYCASIVLCRARGLGFGAQGSLPLAHSPRLEVLEVLNAPNAVYRGA